jgi:hypothetical protein
LRGVDSDVEAGGVLRSCCRCVEEAALVERHKMLDPL